MRQQLGRDLQIEKMEGEKDQDHFQDAPSHEPPIQLPDRMTADIPEETGTQIEGHQNVIAQHIANTDHHRKHLVHDRGIRTPKYGHYPIDHPDTERDKYETHQGVSPPALESHIEIPHLFIQQEKMLRNRIAGPLHRRQLLNVRNRF